MTRESDDETRRIADTYAASCGRRGGPLVDYLLPRPPLPEGMPEDFWPEPSTTEGMSELLDREYQLDGLTIGLLLRIRDDPTTLAEFRNQHEVRFATALYGLLLGDWHRYMNLVVDDPEELLGFYRSALFRLMKKESATAGLDTADFARLLSEMRPADASDPAQLALYWPDVVSRFWASAGLRPRGRLRHKRGQNLWLTLIVPPEEQDRTSTQGRLEPRGDQTAVSATRSAAPPAGQTDRSPAWRPDPTGRNPERYWGGRAWSRMVRDGKVQAVDRGVLPSDSDGWSEPASGWYGDPFARYELRYWDGRAWTFAVQRDGVGYNDPPC